MSATSIKLLQVAAEILGGTRALAQDLGISEALLGRFMSGRRELPNGLFLRTVDIVLGELQGTATDADGGRRRPCA